MENCSGKIASTVVLWKYSVSHNKNHFILKISSNEMI